MEYVPSRMHYCNLNKPLPYSNVLEYRKAIKV
jgi:hypothetical protein